jgi:DNA-directed RNA polymerase
MLARDERAGALVNLTNSDKRHDLYLDIATRVHTAVNLDSDKSAQFWIDCLRGLNETDRRGLVKTPVMTFGYSSTQHGMANKIAEEYADLFLGLEPSPAEAHYLAAKVLEACREVLSKPQAVMDYICAIASYLADRDRFLQWRTPTGFLVFDDYRTPKERVINVRRHGVPIQFTVGDGYEPHINKKKAKNSAAPNFVHSLDSAFLINAAAAEDINVVPVHDSFAVLAPDVKRFGKIARREMQLLYANQEHLADLGRPPRGTLDPLDCGESEYLIS